MLTGLFLAVLSAAVVALANCMDKVLLARFEIPPILIMVFSGLAALCTSLVLLLFAGLQGYPLLVTGAVVASGFCTELLLVPYFAALSLEDASTVIPLYQFVPVLVLVGDAVFLHESLTGLQYLGASGIFLAGLLIALERGPGGLLRPRRAWWYMLVACILAACSVLLFKYGVQHRSYWGVLPYEGLGIALGAVCIGLFPGQLSLLRQGVREVHGSVLAFMALDEAIYICSRYIGLFALTLVSASLVSAATGTQPFFVLIYGTLLSLRFPHILTELMPPSRIALKVAGILLILVGTTLISVPL